MENLRGNIRLALLLAYKATIKGSLWTLAMIILVTSLSFANLVLTPSLMSGVTDAINKQQIDTLFGNIVIDPPAGDYLLQNVSQIENKLAMVPGLEGSAPHLNNNALFEYNWDNSNTAFSTSKGNWHVIGIHPEREARVTTIHNSLIAGSYLSPGERNQIVLGVEITGGIRAESKDFLTLGGVVIGEQVRLTFSDGVQQVFTVKGIFKARQEQANRTAYISAEDMKAAMGLDIRADAANQILIRTAPGSDDNQIIEQLINLRLPGQVRSWLDYGGGIGGIVSSFSVVTSLIGGIGLVVAGVVMFIVIYMHVLHRRRQIGILRAIGVNRGAVLLSYLIQSLSYAVLGIVFGGLIIGYLIKPYFDSYPLDLPIGLISLTIDSTTVQRGIGGLIAASILAGMIPVIKFTREHIIKAIWGN